MNDPMEHEYIHARLADLAAFEINGPRSHNAVSGGRQLAISRKLR